MTSDLHGYPRAAFQRLLDQAAFSPQDELIVLGDVIDRNGDGGVSLLLWMMQQPNIRLILGNHEAMMLSCAFVLDQTMPPPSGGFGDMSFRLLQTWLDNGGEPTLYSLHRLKALDCSRAIALFDYVRKAPLYEIVRISSRSFLLTHAGLGHFSPKKPISAYTADELLWNRPDLNDAYYADIFTVFGHTPTAYYGPEYSGRMILTHTFADIDTGAAMGGAPMLLRLNDMQPFYAGDD